MEIPFRRVPTYTCPGCGHRIVFRPCPFCAARRACPADRADSYAAAVAREARQVIRQARKLAEREAEG